MKSWVCNSSLWFRNASAPLQCIFPCLNVLQFFESACYQMLNYLVTHLKATDAPKVAGTSALHDTATVMCHTVAMPAVAGSPASKA
jgi:hypothetical protein